MLELLEADNVELKHENDAVQAAWKTGRLEWQETQVLTGHGAAAAVAAFCKAGRLLQCRLVRHACCRSIALLLDGICQYMTVGTQAPAVLTPLLVPGSGLPVYLWVGFGIG